MPVGGGGVGLNVWCDEEGTIRFYVSQSGTFDENNTMLKLGRFAMSPFTDWQKGGFTQTLNLENGQMTLSQGDVVVTIWCDVFKPVVHVEVDAKQCIQPMLSYQSWRTEDEPFTQAEGQQSSWKWLAPKKADPNRCVTRRDSINPAPLQLTFFHQNRSETVFDYTVHDQQLDAWKDSLWNPLENRIFGGVLTGGMLYELPSELVEQAPSLAPMAQDQYGRKFHQWHYRSAKGLSKHHHFQITLCTQQSSLNEWEQKIAETQKSVNLKKDRLASQMWWKEYMNRSFFETDGSDAELAAALRNVTLFRYMLGCNFGGEYPTKFNGGLFAFDPLEVDSASMANFKAGKFHPTPDFRKWGGGTFTAQNQRLVYWGMLKSGDNDLLMTQLDFYRNLLHNAEIRSRAYWNHEGACFTEQVENFGLPNTAEYGQKRPKNFDPGLEYNAWLEYEWDTALEFCEMALEAWRYDMPAAKESSTSRPSRLSRSSRQSRPSVPFPIDRYRPLILSCLRFFDEHYQQLALQRGRRGLDSNGHLILFPGSGCETYKMTYNASSTIAALLRVSRDLIRYMETSGDTADLAYVKGLATRIPPIPTRLQKGKLCIAPAIAYERINNVETPQLYPVWPWRIYSLEKDEEGNSIANDLALNTYQCDSVALAHRSSKGWKQDNIWAACLGQTTDAYRLTMEKLKDGPYRFPAFWGPGFDWSPDHNWGGSALIGLEEMLLQEDLTTGAPILFPAWPNDKPIRFRLHAPDGEVIEQGIWN
jgi:hypothetical protein